MFGKSNGIILMKKAFFSVFDEIVLAICLNQKIIQGFDFLFIELRRCTEPEEAL